MNYYYHAGKNLVLNKTELRHYFGMALKKLPEGQLESSGFIVFEDKDGTEGEKIRTISSPIFNNTSD